MLKSPAPSLHTDLPNEKSLNYSQVLFLIIKKIAMSSRKTCISRLRHDLGEADLMKAKESQTIPHYYNLTKDSIQEKFYLKTNFPRHL